MENEDARYFDLNIEKILEAWDPAHAVRELIANALDEQTLTETDEVTIRKSASGEWVIRDYGRGLRFEHLTQNENPEKLNAVGRVIGKFGVGLKDAVATLDRSGINVAFESAHALIGFTHQSKHGFGNVRTLHAVVLPPRSKDITGTRVVLKNIANEEIERAKSFFLKFSNEPLLQATRVGQILEKVTNNGRIYVAGLLIAEEENFAFSYNITSLTEPMKRALNRERNNVGRTAYSERIKSMLLQSTSQKVAKILANQLINLEMGIDSYYVHWKDVAIHACKILNSAGSYIFVTAAQLTASASSIGHAKDSGFQVITIPDNIHSELSGSIDISGNPVRDLGIFQQEWNASFAFKWVSPKRLKWSERRVFRHLVRISDSVGGLPKKVKEVRISETMREDVALGQDALGLWDGVSKSIVIRRDQLKSVSAFAAVLLHEIAHARSGADDVTRDFENELTQMLGSVYVAGAAKGWLISRFLSNR